MARVEIKNIVSSGNVLPAVYVKELYTTVSTAQTASTIDSSDATKWSTVAVQIDGITTATVTVQGSIDGSTFYPIYGRDINDVVVSAIEADGLFVFTERLPLRDIRVYNSAVTTAAVTATILAKNY